MAAAEDGQGNRYIASDITGGFVKESDLSLGDKISKTPSHVQNSVFEGV